MMSEHWPRGTLVTRLYEGDSFALSLIRLSGETRAHRSRTTLRCVYVGLRPRSGSARPAFLTVRRLLYSNESFLSFSSAEFCSAYLTPKASLRAIALRRISPLLRPRPTPRFASAHPLARPSGCLRQGPLRTFGSPVHAPFAPPRSPCPNRVGEAMLVSRT